MGHIDELLVSKLEASSTKKKLISWTEALTLSSDDSGAWVYANDATAGILTLPAAKAGFEVEIFIAADQTGDTHITVPSGYFVGGLHLVDPATAGDTNFFLSDGNSNDFINLDADTKGRLAGGLVRIVCDGTNWHVEGTLVGDGSLATPFADAES